MSASDGYRRLYAAVVRSALNDIRRVTTDVLHKANGGSHRPQDAKRAQEILKAGEMAMGWVFAKQCGAARKNISIQLCAEVLGLDLKSLRKHAVKLALDNDWSYGEQA